MLHETNEIQGQEPMASTSPISPQLWARLPLELIREVLVMLALTSEQDARKLRLVSSDVNVLVLPLIYRHIVITKPEDVVRLTTTLLPKRKLYVPSLKSRLHFPPRPLSTYQVDSCVLVINERGPSIETALASVAPIFGGISKLAITARNLQAHGYWLRQHPIQPNVMMLLHYGSPALVNFYDPIFENVTHLYTSITQGHRYSSVTDLPALTHLAVSTRPYLPEPTAKNVAASLRHILNQCKRLQVLVLVIAFRNDAESDQVQSSWHSWLEECFADDRFVLLPDYRPPRIEWDDILNESLEPRDHLSLPSPFLKNGFKVRTKPESVWSRALSWKKWMKATESSESRVETSEGERSTRQTMTKQKVEDMVEAGFFRSYRGPEWEIDLVQRDNYHPPAPSDPDLNTHDGFHSAFG